MAFGLFLQNRHESVLGFFGLILTRELRIEFLSFLFKVLIELNWRTRVITILFFFKLLFLFLEVRVCPAPDIYFPFGLVILYTVRYCDMTHRTHNCLLRKLSSGHIFV